MARTAKKEKALTPEEKLAQALVPDVEQPYRVPKNWSWVYFGSICNFINGYAFKSKLFSSDMGVPVIRISDIVDNVVSLDNAIKTTEESIEDRFIVRQGDLLIAMSGATTGKNGIYLSTQKAFLNQRVGNIKIVHQNLVLPFFRNYYIQLQTEEILKNAYGGAQPNISSNKICEMSFPLPPIAEQQRIVDHIEGLFAKLDEAKEKAQAVVDGFEDRRAAILHKAFTGELTEEWRRNNGISRDTWNKCTIGDIFTHTTGKALKKSNTNGSLHKYITTSNLYWGRFDFSEIREMYFTDDELDKCTAKKGDLLICNGGDVGRAAIWNYDYDICIQNHISKLRKKQNNIDVVFCYYFFMLSKIKGKINSKGIGIASLSAKDLLAMPIDVPSIEEQYEISSVLDELFNNEQQAKDAAEQVIEQIDTMKKSILARAFRGELGTNDPNDESAEDLLKRVLVEGQSDDTISKPAKKRTTIPKEIDSQLSTGMERDIIKLFIKADNENVSMDAIMSLSSKKFEILDTLRTLEKKGIIQRNDAGDYSLIK